MCKARFTLFFVHLISNSMVNHVDMALINSLFCWQNCTSFNSHIVSCRMYCIFVSKYPLSMHDQNCISSWSTVEWIWGHQEYELVIMYILMAITRLPIYQHKEWVLSYSIKKGVNMFFHELLNIFILLHEYCILFI